MMPFAEVGNIGCRAGGGREDDTLFQLCGF